jgi:hypothetical protein
VSLIDTTAAPLAYTLLLATKITNNTASPITISSILASIGGDYSMPIGDLTVYQNTTPDIPVDTGSNFTLIGLSAAPQSWNMNVSAAIQVPDSSIQYLVIAIGLTTGLAAGETLQIDDPLTISFDETTNITDTQTAGRILTLTS